ncbi:PAS domain-containing protein [Streptomyces sp. NPDC006602]|uniref:PAS domain-containing protein n=1 Tax=Streptomyces sp. NPDC006602 TaxID=3364751 RepID=UPI003685105D
MDAGLSSTDSLLLALQQATAGLGGLGGLVHRREPRSGLLRLVAVSGLAPKTGEAWAWLRQDEDTAPARAVRRGAYVWQDEDTAGTGASGMASVPVPGPAGPAGALSVLTAEPGEPGPARQSFLRAVADWASAYLEETSALTAGFPSGEALDSASRPVLRNMGDGLLTVDEDWTITFCNKEAERVIGTGQSPLGSTLWDLPAGRVRGLEAQCRRASAEGTPIAFDLRWPTDQRLYHFRLVPVKGSGLTVSFADVTVQRSRDAGSKVAERTARMGELTVGCAGEKADSDGG